MKNSYHRCYKEKQKATFRINEIAFCRETKSCVPLTRAESVPEIAYGLKMFVLAVFCSLIQELSGTLITYIEPGSSYGFLSGAGMILGVVCVLMTITCNVHPLVATTLYGGNFGGPLMDAITNDRIARLFAGIKG